MQTSKRIAKGLVNLDKVIEGIDNFKRGKLTDLAKDRLKTCSNCINFMYDTIEKLHVKDIEIPELTKKMCNLCGCVLSYKLRTKIIETKNCPLKND